MSTTAPTPARRRNADYRWTVTKVEAFLRALGRCGKVAEAARAVGMGRQSAYRLRARLADPRFQHAFELARRQGLAAREAARAEARRAASQWGEPGLAAFAHLRGDGSGAQGDGSGAQGDGSGAQGDRLCAQGDTRPAQGDSGPAQGDSAPAQGHTPAAPGPARPSQGDTFAAQGDTPAAQGDGFRRKATF